jgi:hypothetical protein
VTPVPPQPAHPPVETALSPQAASGPSPAEAGRPEVSQAEAASSESTAGGLALVLVLLVALLVVVGATVVVVLMITKGDVPVSQRAENRERTVVQQQRAEAIWTDAVGKSLTIDDASVKIDRVEWGQVRGRDSHGRIITSDDPYLSIMVTVRNRGRGQFLYQSWHSGPHPAVLMDENNREFGRFDVPRFNAIEWHIPDELLERGRQTDDRLIFAIPGDVKHDAVTAFRLELPAQAVEREGVFRFRIPVEMIDGF